MFIILDIFDQMATSFYYIHDKKYC